MKDRRPSVASAASEPVGRGADRHRAAGDDRLRAEGFRAEVADADEPLGARIRDIEQAADGSMTLIEHVRELRNRLFYASLGIIGGLIVKVGSRMIDGSLRKGMTITFGSTDAEYEIDEVGYLQLGHFAVDELSPGEVVSLPAGRRRGMAVVLAVPRSLEDFTTERRPGLFGRIAGMLSFA